VAFEDILEFCVSNSRTIRYLLNPRSIDQKIWNYFILKERKSICRFDELQRQLKTVAGRRFVNVEWQNGMLIHKKSKLPVAILHYAGVNRSSRDFNNAWQHTQFTAQAKERLNKSGIIPPF